MSDWNETRRGLLQSLRNIGSAGRAEGEPPERIGPGYFPVTGHLRSLDPDVVLVVGPRGSGKTEIARVLTDQKLRQAASDHAGAVRLPPADSHWRCAYPDRTHCFDAVGLRILARRPGVGAEQLRDLWLAYLVRTLGNELAGADRAALQAVLSPPGADIEAITNGLQSLGTRPIVALDRLNARLESESRFVFVTYDELDTLGGGAWDLVEAGVQGLVAFWAAYARRWSHLRAKLFLRTDLYERHATVGGADLAKLAAGRVELGWSDRDLYGVLLKRLANLDQDVTRYIRAVKGMVWKNDPTLGLIPVLTKWQDAKPVVERMVGPYMGANQKKGLVYRWLIDHVRDGRGRVFPRPFVQLIEKAAGEELSQLEATKSPRLLAPTSLRRALDGVSMDYVKQALDEWPWLEAVREKLQDSRLVPWERELELHKLLVDFRGGEIPPFGGRELLQYLLEIGILRRRSDGRVDAPDLYLRGLGLTRKGGVRKRA